MNHKLNISSLSQKTGGKTGGYLALFYFALYPFSSQKLIFSKPFKTHDMIEFQALKITYFARVINFRTGYQRRIPPSIRGIFHFR